MKGRAGQGRDGKEREGKGRKGKRRKGKGREGKGKSQPGPAITRDLFRRCLCTLQQEDLKVCKTGTVLHS